VILLARQHGHLWSLLLQEVLPESLPEVETQALSQERVLHQNWSLTHHPNRILEPSVLVRQLFRKKDEYRLHSPRRMQEMPEIIEDI
jgi:hypothetical protein